MKKSKNRNQGFSCYFCLRIEGSVPLTSGSGSRRQKHTDPDPQRCFLGRRSSPVSTSILFYRVIYEYLIVRACPASPAVSATRKKTKNWTLFASSARPTSTTSPPPPRSATAPAAQSGSKRRAPLQRLAPSKPSTGRRAVSRSLKSWSGCSRAKSWRRWSERRPGLCSPAYWRSSRGSWPTRGWSLPAFTASAVPTPSWSKRSPSSAP